MKSNARFLIGIDLGTTNSSLAYVDSLDPSAQSQTFSCMQWQGPQIKNEEPILPSFLYLPPEVDRFPQVFAETDEVDPSTLDLNRKRGDLQRIIVGRYACSRLAETPGRVIQSAKSWLVHRGADPEEAILPWGSKELDVTEKLSPVQVSSCYLSHFREAWNNTIGKYSPEYSFENQDITITVPASFDEVAQRLTLKAATLAGFPDKVRLLEEPQAAFYHWLETNKESASLKTLKALPRARILVCDVGGGTTDFSLFEMVGDNVQAITRIAVSDHVLLGGDNIDLTIAHYAESKLEQSSSNNASDVHRQSVKVGIKQWNSLLFQSRMIKERILADRVSEGENGGNESGVINIALPSEGRSLFSQSLSLSLQSSEVRQIVEEGFFPLCNREDEVKVASTGLREFGLPYASDSAVTRHLAAFLRGIRDISDRNKNGGAPDVSPNDSRTDSWPRISAVLYTGGSLKPQILRDRLTRLLSSWQDNEAPIVLENDAMELGVARGAAYYGAMRRSRLVFIHAGYAHSIYLELAAPHPFRESSVGKGSSEDTKLVCILPRGTEQGEQVALDHLEFEALVDRPVRFQTYYSTRRNDPAGAVVRLESDIFHKLPSLQTKLKLTEEGKKVQVRSLRVTLQSQVTELGLLQISCVPREVSGDLRTWQLEFNLRKDTTEFANIAASGDSEKDEDSPDAAVDLEVASKLILYHYGKEKHHVVEKGKKSASSPKSLFSELESALRSSRDKWELVTLRALWKPLSQGITRRSRSLAHETTWLALAGWCLRPGFGSALDEHRLDELWRVFHLGLSFSKERSAQVQWWIMWRRVAGGLNRERQEALYTAISMLLQKRGIEDAEVLNLVVSLERISTDKRINLASKLLNLIRQSKEAQKRQYVWALGRIGARVPFYAGYESVIPPEHIERWFNVLEPLDWTANENRPLIDLFAQICRRIGDRHLDVEDSVRKRVQGKLKSSAATDRQLRLLEEVIELNGEEQSVLFGDSIPIGIKLIGRRR